VLSASAATDALAPKAVPPASALLPCRNRRRVVVLDLSSTSIVLLIADPRLKFDPHETFHEVDLQFARISKTGDFGQD
jgi:hypothetical protein